MIMCIYQWYHFQHLQKKVSILISTINVNTLPDNTNMSAKNVIMITIDSNIASLIMDIIVNKLNK